MKRHKDFLLLFRIFKNKKLDNFRRWFYLFWKYFLDCNKFSTHNLGASSALHSRFFCLVALPMQQPPKGQYHQAKKSSIQVGARAPVSKPIVQQIHHLVAKLFYLFFLLYFILFFITNLVKGFAR